MNLQAERIASLCEALQLGWVAAEYDAMVWAMAACALKRIIKMCFQAPDSF